MHDFTTAEVFAAITLGQIDEMILGVAADSMIQDLERKIEAIKAAKELNDAASMAKALHAASEGDDDFAAAINFACEITE